MKTIADENYFDALVSESLKSGSNIDLSDCKFGKSGITPDYYTFLAGFCKFNKVQRVLEIGTFKGGSTSAMHAGIVSAGARLPKIVTVDIEERNTEQINKKQGIKKIIGDPLALPVLERILEEFTHDPIDLLFLDSTKVGRTVMSQFSVLLNLLNPKWVIMDDIAQTRSMELMWKIVANKYGNKAVNVGLKYPGIRKQGEVNPNNTKHPGFGLVEIG